MPINRRRFLRATATLAGLAASAGLYAWKIEPYWLEFVHQSLPVSNLPKSLEGKILMQISDIHIGNRFDYQFIIDSFTRAKAFEPDIVVHTGDYVSWENKEQLHQLRTVMRKAPRGKLGTVAILGNHDYGHRWREAEVANHIAAVLEETGISVLRNEAQLINGLNIIGIDEWLGTNFHPEAALATYTPEAANLVLCHNPDVCDLPVWGDYEGWILAGHTHGGQCKPPFLAPPIMSVRNKRYTEGAFDLHDGRKLYINRALGCSYPVRFNVRPEITVFRLERCSGDRPI